MPDRVKRDPLESILSGINATEKDRRHLAEVALMVALADSFIDDDDVARIIEKLSTYGELDGVQPKWIADRADELRENAPLFSEAREEVMGELTHPKARRLGLALAAKLCASVRPLQEEERAVFDSLAEAFKVPDAERPALLAPWAKTGGFGADTLDYQRCDFNAPDNPAKQTLFEAMRAAEKDQEFRFLTHKITAVRGLISKLFETADIVAVGERVRVGPYAFRMDAVIEHASVDANIPGYQHWIVRSLAPGEALHPLEHPVLSTLALRLDETAHVLIVHTGDLAPTDKVFVQSFDPQIVREERVEL